MTTQTLEQRIVASLNNPDSGSVEISELALEVEAAISTAETIAEQQRANAVDLVASPDAKAAHAMLVETELARDRLRAVLPRIRSQLSMALQTEATERWHADYHRVAEQLDQAAAAFRRYPELAVEMATMFSLAETVDKEVSRINGSAPDGVHDRLRGVELTARDMQQFMVDIPSLAATVELRDWDNSGKKIWPQGFVNSLAIECAQMIAPSDGSHWSDPTIRQQHRHAIEAEQRRLGEFYIRQTAEQERRKNAEEAERFNRRSA